MIKHTAYPNEIDTTLLIKTSRTEMVFDCTSEQYLLGMASYKTGCMMQDAFHFLSADEREFLISGTTPVKFNSLFPEGD